MLKTIIIDDELPAVKVLTSFVESIPFLELTLATTNAFEGLNVLNMGQVDLLFVDIEMPDISGIELLKSLQNSPLVILTTAYEEYALQGFELDVIDYLMKPIRFERFVRAVNKAQRSLPFKTEQFTAYQEENEYITLKVEYKNIKISFEDILYVEGLKDYVKVYTVQGMYMPRLNLKNIEQKLPASKFIRVHRSFIIPIDKIISYQKTQVQLEERSIPIGVTYQEKLMDRLDS